MARDDAEAENAHLREALKHRTVIATAVGILMERYAIDDVAAFKVLARISQQHNLKVYVLAEDLVEGRDILLP